MALSTGFVLQKDHYRIVKLLKKGGFGAVYRAYDLHLRRPCAIKENHETSEAAQRQFEREAQLLADLHHKYLPRVTDHFIVPGQGQYLVMDFIEGEDLETMLGAPGNPLPEEQVLGWIDQICEALDYLHTRPTPYIHRDVKPANIKITPQGNAVLVDFGIYKALEPGSDTTVGARAVTPGYSPPEQYGRGFTDTRSDIYALGATLYHLLTGAHPPESIDRQLGMSMTPPGALNPVLSEQTEAAILKAMSVETAARFQSIRDFQAALSAPLEDTFIADVPVAAAAAVEPAIPTTPPPQPPVSTPRPSTAPPSQPPATPRKGPQPLVWFIGGIIGAIVLLGCLGGVLYWAGLIPGTTRDPTATSSPVVQASPTDKPAAEPTDTSVSPPPSQPTPTNPLIPTEPPEEEPTQPPPVDPSTPPDCNSSGDLWMSDVDGMQLACVPAGEFKQGESQSSKRLAAFWVDVTEVTNAMYELCVQAGTCSPPVFDQNAPPGFQNYFGNNSYDDYPVAAVSWDQAEDYCTWAGRRLLSGDEWEKAARGTDGRTYPWGGLIDCGRANYQACGKEFTSRVRSYPSGVSPNGAYDMAGNVFEWVADTCESGRKSLMGGSWNDETDFLRTFSTACRTTNSQSSKLGFRCGMDAER
jgi:serine/threonine protein kinase